MQGIAPADAAVWIAVPNFYLGQTGWIPNSLMSSAYYYYYHLHHHHHHHAAAPNHGFYQPYAYYANYSSAFYDPYSNGYYYREWLPVSSGHSSEQPTFQQTRNFGQLPMRGDEDTIIFEDHIESPGLWDWLLDDSLLFPEPTATAVDAGLSEDTISKCLKTRISDTSETTNEEPELCVVCQIEYEKNEKIGILQCGHEYHADCISRWLTRKNLCPVCKATALATRS